MEDVLQLAHAALPVRKQLHDLEPGLIRERVKPPGGSADVRRRPHGHVLNISSYIDVSTVASRPHPYVHRQTDRRAAAIRGLEARRDKVDRPARAYSCREPRDAPNRAQVAVAALPYGRPDGVHCGPVSAAYLSRRSVPGHHGGTACTRSRIPARC